MNRIVLIGFMGSGKSTIARKLSMIYNIPIIEMDYEIEQQEKRKISDIFQVDGEEYFRKLETRFIEELDINGSFILSTGGGVILEEKNRELLKQIGLVIYLKSDISNTLRNVRENPNRPLLMVENIEEKIAKLLDYREPLYSQVADEIVMVTDKTVMAISEEIMQIIKGDNHEIISN
ncbi:MAG: shikimate kinase [Candidatus Izimaplasma sp.]|nr:shikimate kinase [Candidatus Izimaplasma bacterium]